jgi:beta-glucosidase
VEENFDKVIVIVNSANVMELGELEADENVDAIVWLAYPGSRGNVALAEIVAGAINPSGHTVDTWPADLTKDPTFANAVVSTYTNTPYEAHMIEYEEGIYVGYRYYETAAAEGFIDYDSAVVYPFGYGLSYTTFKVGKPKITKKSAKVGTSGQLKGIVVVVPVTNTGSCEGTETVQVYVKRLNDPGAPIKALKGFQKLTLKPGETKKAVIALNGEAFEYYDENIDELAVKTGQYQILCGTSSRDADLQKIDFTVK